MKACVSILLAAWCCQASAEIVQVKYHGPVTLEAFDCAEIREASDVARICFDPAQRYMLVRLKATYYHYCEVDAGTARAFQAASSKRQYFDARIKGSGSDGPFDCRAHPIPKKYRL